MTEAQGPDRAGQTSGMTLVEEPERSVVRAWGEIDLAVRRASGELCRAVAERGLPVTIDAGDVTFMDSTGMSVLVRIARDGESLGYPVTLHRAPWLLRELLAITGVDQLLELVDPQPAPTPTPLTHETPSPPPRVHGEESTSP